MRPMGGGGGIIRRMAEADDEKPKLTWPLLKRVLAYAGPYRVRIAAMLLLILAATGLQLLNPLILRDLIDRTIPAGDLRRLAMLAGALLLIPTVGGLIQVLQRRINAQVGEGVIYDLRVALYERLQRMSLRFFTHTKVGEIMSRLNNDVVGAQNAISNTIVGIITNIIQAIAVLVVMVSMEWRLTLISIVIMPLFILAAQRLGNRLRDIARQQMEANAQMNAMMNETLNIGQEDVDTLKGTRSRLKVGARLSREDMLLLALMASENRAASALARHYPGGNTAFIEAMNHKAAAIGLKDTRFEDPTGLTAANVSSARDLTKMVAAASHYPLIRELSTTGERTLLIDGRPIAYHNTNMLVRSPASGWEIAVSKTGYIREAGKCLVMQAWLNNRPVVIVLLDSWGKLTRIGDANRIKRWIENASAAGSRPSAALGRRPAG